MPRYARLFALVFWLAATPAWAQTCGGVGQLPCPPSTAVGVFLGDTGHDFVSTSPYMFGNRVMDWHVRVTGLRAVPVSATVLAFDADGHTETFRWVTQGDTVHWAAWMIVSSAGVDLWIEPRGTAVSFDVRAVYADGSTETAPRIHAVPPPEPPPAPPAPVVPQPLVIEIGVPACALEQPPCFIVDIKLVPIAP